MPRHWTTNPYDGYTIALVIANLEKLARVAVRGIHSDKGYRGHNCPDRFKVFISGPVRHTTNAVRREMRRRAAVEPVIVHLQGRSRKGRNYREGRDGDSTDAILTAAGYNFSALLRQFRRLLHSL
jgi:IS5 family transposase